MQATETTITAAVTVDAAPDRAFSVFTDGMSAWWPLDTHHIGQATPTQAVIEPREGGRWLERAPDGGECDWGRVLAWEPARRVVLTWQLTSAWGYDPGFVTEVEVRFSPAGDGRTRAELEHRDL